MKGVEEAVREVAWQWQPPTKFVWQLNVCVRGLGAGKPDSAKVERPMGHFAISATRTTERNPRQQTVAHYHKKDLLRCGRDNCRLGYHHYVNGVRTIVKRPHFY